MSSTGEPDGRVSDVVATWAIAADAATADGLATALFVSEPECLRSSLSAGYACWRTAGSSGRTTSTESSFSELANATPSLIRSWDTERRQR